MAAQVQPLRVVTMHGVEPFVFEHANGTFSGYLVDLLRPLLDAAGLTQPAEIYAVNGSGGSAPINGVWPGVMGELTRPGGANLSLAPLTLTSARAPYIAATVPFMEADYAILVHVQKLRRHYSFLSPFRGGVWLAFLASLLVVALLLTLLDRATRTARMRALERARGAEYAVRVNRKSKPMPALMATIMMATNGGAPPKAWSWAPKVLFCAWAFFCVIFLAAYTSSLTAMLTAAQLKVPINSLVALQRSNLLFGVPANSSIVAFFSQHDDPVIASLARRMVSYASFTSGVADLRTGRIAAFVNDAPLAAYAAQKPNPETGECDLTVADQTFGPGSLILGLPKEAAPLAHNLSLALLQLADAGLQAELRRKWFQATDECAEQLAAQVQQLTSLGVKQLWSVFLILVGGSLTAALYALTEVSYLRACWGRRDGAVRHWLRNLSRTHLLGRTLSYEPAAPAAPELGGGFGGGIGAAGGADIELPPSGAAAATARHLLSGRKQNKAAAVAAAAH